MVVKKRGDFTNDLPPDEQLPDGDYEPRPAGLDRAAELELIDTALLGDAQAFSELFEHYRPALYGLCRRRLNDASLAEDVVQEAFLKAFKNLSSYDRGKPVWPWISTIAYRMCVDLQRHRVLTQYFADLGVAVDEDAEMHGHTRSALDEVIAAEDRAELWESLNALPKRQRRALLFYAQDGMSYADIAAAEGISIGAVKLLIVRARKKMRTRSGENLPAIVFPLTWLRWKLQRIEERVRMTLSISGEGLSTACVQAACLSALVTVVVATTLPSASFDDNDTVISETAVLATQSGTSQTVLQNPNIAAPTKPSLDSQQSVANPTNSPLDDLINPNQSATPETTTFTSIAASPDYENDHTILASGFCQGCTSNVLFASHDGGASWKPKPSRLPLGTLNTMVLSPAYPHDPRIFVLGDFGFQQSDDGGEIFRPTSSLWVTSFAISPSFGVGDSRILIGAKTLFEYDAGTGVTRPASLAVPLSGGGSSYSSITFSPSYMSDSTIFVADRYGKGDLVHSRFDQTTLYRCKESACDETEFPFRGPLTLRLSPRFEQDSFAYVFASRTLFVSNDGGRAFQEVQFPFPDRWSSIADVAIPWAASSAPAIFASVVGYQPGIYNSLDSGHSWSRTTRIDIPGFQYGASKLIATPTGRFLATGAFGGMWGGIACSENGGQTWAPRCTPEQ